jgi:hypothetical protein
VKTEVKVQCKDKIKVYADVEDAVESEIKVKVQVEVQDKI